MILLTRPLRCEGSPFMVSQSQPDENPLDTGSVPQARADRHVPEAGGPAPGGMVTGRTWVLVLAAGIAAGVCSWLATEGVLVAYRTFLRPPMNSMPTMEDARRIL